MDDGRDMGAVDMGEGYLGITARLGGENTADDKTDDQERGPREWAACECCRSHARHVLALLVKWFY